LQEARVKYRQQHDNDPTDTSAVLGYMKCMEAMGDWGDLVQLCNDSWDQISKPGEEQTSLKKAALRAARWAIVNFVTVVLYVPPKTKNNK